MIWPILRKLLFYWDAEVVHRFSIFLIRQTRRWFGSTPICWISGVKVNELTSSRPYWAKIAGLNWVSPVGLAAGFDKDGEILSALPALGFGFAEIGTVTPRPQPGNPRPRLFRDAQREVLFNRMGFNNLGAEVVAKHLSEARPVLPDWFRVGINLGKNKETPPERAAEDYAAAVKPFLGLVDYVVVNVSSPNTPGLRDLQQVDALRPIIEGVARELRGRAGITPPLFLKLAPEMTGPQFHEVLKKAPEWGVQGWILTNTLQGEWKVSQNQVLPGGLSGSVLNQISLERLKEAKAITSLPCISVGGILTPEDAILRLKAGAALVQLYSGWILKGPSFPNLVEKECLKTQKP